MEFETRFHLKDGRTIAINDAFDLNKEFLKDFEKTRETKGSLTLQAQGEEIKVDATNITSIEIAVWD